MPMPGAPSAPVNRPGPGGISHPERWLYRWPSQPANLPADSKVPNTARAPARRRLPELDARTRRHRVAGIEIEPVAIEFVVAVAGMELGSDEIDVLHGEDADRERILAIGADTLADIEGQRQRGTIELEHFHAVAELAVDEGRVVAPAPVRIVPARGRGDVEAIAEPHRNRAVDPLPGSRCIAVGDRGRTPVSPYRRLSRSATCRRSSAIAEAEAPNPAKLGISQRIRSSRPSPSMSPKTSLTRIALRPALSSTKKAPRDHHHR